MDVPSVMTSRFNRAWRRKTHESFPFQWSKAIKDDAHAALLVLVVRPLYFKELSDQHPAKAALYRQMSLDKVSAIYNLTTRTSTKERYTLLGFENQHRLYHAINALRIAGTFESLPRRAKWVPSEEQKALVFDLFNKGLARQAIASQLHVSHITLGPWMEKWGLSFMDTEQRNAKILASRKAGATLRELAEEFRLSTGYLSVLVRDLKDAPVPFDLELRAALARTDFPSDKLDEAVKLLMYLTEKPTEGDADVQAVNEGNGRGASGHLG